MCSSDLFPSHDRRSLMDFFQSFIDAIFVMVVVFAVLACLYGFIKLFSFGIRKIDEKKEKPRNDLNN